MSEGEENSTASAAESAGSGKTAMIITIITAVLTGGMTLLNTWTKSSFEAKVTQAEQRSDSLEKLREFAFQENEAAFQRTVEQSKEKTERLRFVSSLLPTLKDVNIGDRDVTINLIRLSLSDSESALLFAGFAASSDPKIREAGSSAIEFIKQDNRNHAEADQHERDGFQKLIDGKFEDAKQEFAAAESAAPTIHNAFEIRNLLEAKKSDLADTNKRNEVLRQIVQNHSWGAPKEMLDSLRKKIRPAAAK